MKQENFVYIILGLFAAYFLFSSREGIMTATKGLMDKVADAIQSFEGWQPGSISYRNNNPGNIRFFGGEHWQGQIGVDSRQFVIFDTYENGRRALIKLLTNAATGAIMPNYTPQMSVYEFFAKYAPATDNNEPRHYAEFFAGQVGINPSDSISTLV